MDIKQLNTFVVLSKNKNYTKTADELGYAQSSISAQIQQLEQELNTKLFDRIGKKVFLTSSGELVLPYAKEILALTSTIKERIDSGLSSHGQITIGASESICIFKLPAIVKAYKKSHPNIDLQIKLTENDQVLQQLTENSMDIALTIGNPLKHSSIRCLSKSLEDLLILSAPTHPLTAKKSQDIQDFSNASFIFTGLGCNYRAAFEHELQSHGIPYQIVLEAGSVQAIKEMAMSGLGLCVLPKLAVQRELDNKLLCALPYKKEFELYIQLSCHKSKWISPHLADFIEIIKETL